MKHNKIDREGIEEMVNIFYGKIRETPTLKNIFESQIGNTPEDWAPHLETMYSFWSSVLLREGSYSGNPMAVHKALPFFEPELFEDWLAAFKETVFVVFEGEVATDLFQRALKIAQTLRAGVTSSRVL